MRILPIRIDHVRFGGGQQHAFTSLLTEEFVPGHPEEEIPRDLVARFPDRKRSLSASYFAMCIFKERV